MFQTFTKNFFLIIYSAVLIYLDKANKTQKFKRFFSICVDFRQQTVRTELGSFLAFLSLINFTKTTQSISENSDQVY